MTDTKELRERLRRHEGIGAALAHDRGQTGRFVAAVMDEAASAIERLEAQRDQLARFARWAIQESAFSGHELDGGEVQEQALACMLIVRTVYAPARHGPSDVAKPGDEWFEFAEVLERKS